MAFAHVHFVPFHVLFSAGPFLMNEVWTFNNDGSITTPATAKNADGSFKFPGGVLCLDSAFTSEFPQQLLLWGCDVNNRNQRWKWNTDSATPTTIENVGTGFCLDASKNGIGQGIQMSLRQCNVNQMGQRFSRQAMVPTLPIAGQASSIYAFGTNLVVSCFNYVTPPGVGTPVRLELNGISETTQHNTTRHVICIQTVHHVVCMYTAYTYQVTLIDCIPCYVCSCSVYLECVDICS